jgi:hypothetical protein
MCNRHVISPPLDPLSLPDHIGTIPASTEALLRAELHPLDIILPHSHAIALSFFHFEPPTHCHWPFPSLSSLTPTVHPGPGLLYNSDIFALGLLIPEMEAVGTSETSVDNNFTRQYILEDNSEQQLYKLIQQYFSTV